MPSSSLVQELRHLFIEKCTAANVDPVDMFAEVIRPDELCLLLIRYPAMSKA